MRHEPASTFEPTPPSPPAAQPFDAKPYLDRARALGLMVFPVIMPSGSSTFGICAYPGHSWSVGNERLAREFGAALKASSDGTAAIVEALCADFDLDLSDVGFNEKVNAVCYARSRASTDGDKRLIELCKRAKVFLEKDLASINLVCDLTEKFEAIQPQKPTYKTALGAVVREKDDAREMRSILADGLAEWSRSATKAYRSRIANVVAYEKEFDRVRREIGLTQAEAAHRRIWNRSASIVGDVAELPATTPLGLAYKGAVLLDWKMAGNGLHDEGETLAFSIADDARMLGTGGQIMQASGRRRPSQQVHH